jgi:hypothetical protein
MRVACLRRKNATDRQTGRQADIDGLIRLCYSLTVEREEHIKTEEGKEERSFMLSNSQID